MLSKNKKYYSHKFHSAGFNYEIGLLIFEQKVLWMNGPFVASTPNITIYCTGGLKAAMPANKIIVADNGY